MPETTSPSEEKKTESVPPAEGAAPTPESADAEAAAEHPKSAPVAPPSPLKDLRVLVTDDSRPMRMLLKKMLESGGALVDEALNGNEAISRLHKAHAAGQPYQLALMDMMMPEKNGIETLRDLRADPTLKTLPVIMVTTEGERSKVLECAKYNLSGYILKPFTTQKLLETVLQALEHGDA